MGEILIILIIILNLIALFVADQRQLKADLEKWEEHAHHDD